jgi:hypothetical protein
MGYTLSEQIDFIKREHNKNALSKAIQQEKRIRFHTQEKTPEQTELNEWLGRAKKLLPKDKFKTFVETLTFPLPTIDFATDLVNNFQAIFRGNNRYINYEFANNELADDYQQFLSDAKIFEEYEQTSFENFKYYINSVLIVDMPQQATTPPSPYFFFKQISHIKALNLLHNGTFDFLAIVDGERILTYDNEKYISFQIVNNEPDFNNPVINPHTLGVIPAKWFWDDKINGVERRHPISKELGNLDNLLFKTVAHEIADLYVPFPIVQTPPADCDYIDENKHRCNSGFLVDESGIFLIDKQGSQIACPVCGTHALTGPGSHIEHEPAEGKNATETTFISADVAGVEYYDGRLTDLKDKISFYVTGRVNFKNDQAKNETQVLGSFETQTNNLFDIKRNFESSLQFVLDTIARLRYGANFERSTVNLGTEFMLRSLSELYDIYSTARSEGFSPTTLDMIQNQIINTEHQHNESMRARQRFLSELEPYRHFTLKEVVEQSQTVPTDPIDLIIKQNFANFVQRFERERFNILNFPASMPLNRRVDRVLTEFKNYANEIARNAGQVNRTTNGPE